MCYCDVCNTRTQGLRKNNIREVPVKGTTINVSYTGVFCDHCGAELYDEDTEAAIFKAAINKYRKSKHLLEPGVIASALKRMTPEELAEKAGCAVKEIIGASHGAIQSVETDRKLRSVLGMTA